MSEDIVIAFLNMQYHLISNPIKKIKLFPLIDKILEQRQERKMEERTQYTIALYLEELTKKKKRSKLEKQWLQLSLQLFQELENDAVKKRE